MWGRIPTLSYRAEKYGLAVKMNGCEDVRLHDSHTVELAQHGVYHINGRFPSRRWRRSVLS